MSTPKKESKKGHCKKEFCKKAANDDADQGKHEFFPDLVKEPAKDCCCKPKKPNDPGCGPCK